MVTAKKLLIGGAVLGGVVGIGVALSGTAKASPTTEPNWPHKLSPVQTDEEIREAKACLCAIRDGMKNFSPNRDYKELVRRALQKCYPDTPAPWNELIDRYATRGAPQHGDHASVPKAVRKFRQLADAMLSKQSEAERQKWCGVVEPEDKPEPEEMDINPDLPDVTPDEDEDVPGETAQQKRRRIWTNLHSEKYEPGKFRQSKAGDSGLELAAWWALFNAGAPVGPTWNQKDNYYKLILPLTKAMSDDEEWNVPLYGRASIDYWAGKNKMSVGRAWRPYHADAKAAVLQGNFPRRTITPNGNRVAGSGANQYGYVWIPDFDRDAAIRDQVLIITQQSPPQKLLRLLAK